MPMDDHARIWPAACLHLAQRDPVLAELIDRYPRRHFEPPHASPFETLLRAIVGQQISVKAADSIWGRFRAAIGPEFNPQRVLACPADALRACGLSQQKLRYMMGIAEAFAHQRLSPSLWPTWDDDAVIAELTQLSGVGVWTAHMFLMFSLQRPNVLPLGDLGLLNAYEKAYAPRGLSQLVGPARQKALATKVQGQATRHWAPYASVAVWYLWRSLDPHEVHY